MRKLDRLWKTLEAAPGLADIRSEWMRMLGSDFSSVSKFLKPTNDLVEVYPCDTPGGDGCPRRVVIHGPSDIVAVCGNSPAECSPLSLNREAIAIWRLDMEGLLQALAQAMGIAVTQVERIHSPLTWFLATTSGTTVYYFTLAGENGPFQMVVADLALLREEPFCLITSRPRKLDRRTRDLLDKRRSRCVSLDTMITWEAARGFIGLEAASPPPVVARPIQVSPPLRNHFRKKGDFWQISFGGKSVILKHRLGFSYIAELLRSPNTPISSVTLRDCIWGNDASRQIGDRYESIDETAQDRYGRRLRELKLERQEAEAEVKRDPMWLNRIDLEVADIERHLDTSTNRRGRPRLLGDDADNARKSVRKGVSTAFDVIREAHQPLHDHLRANIDLGNDCVYTRAVAVWEF